MSEGIEKQLTVKLRENVSFWIKKRKKRKIVYHYNLNAVPSTIVTQNI